MPMHSQARADSSRSRDASPPTDWAALEQQLCRTKTILQEILEHLQGVLRNLRSARAGFKGHARTGARPDKPGAKTGFRTTRTASPGYGARPQDPKTARPRPSHTRFERTAPGPEEAFGQGVGQPRDSQAGQAEPGATSGGRTFGSFRGGAAFGGTQAKDAGRTGNPYRTFSGAGTAGASSSSGQTGQSARFGQTGQAGPAGPYSRTASGQSRQRETFGQTSRPGQTRTSHSSNAYDTRRETVRPDGSARHRFSGERQERGRQAARNSGMNLKSAYDILCLDYPCTPVEIKNAYRGMARMFHPDLGGDEEVMKDVNLAYELAMRFCAGPRRSGASWSA